MSRWIAAHRKFLAAAALGAVELAGYIIADPRDLPGWVVTLALAVNAAGVYWFRNTSAKPSRQAYADRVRRVNAHDDEVG